jgi:hypothetical protein
VKNGGKIASQVAIAHFDLCHPMHFLKAHIFRHNSKFDWTYRFRDNDILNFYKKKNLSFLHPRILPKKQNLNCTETNFLNVYGSKDN